MTLRWVKDQKVEANLRNMGISFQVERVPKDNNDLGEGLRRQARMIGKLDQDYVLQLSLKMLEPEAAFPMTILQHPPRGKLWPWSGNHRLAAFELAYPEAPDIEAYTVCIKDPVMLDVFPRVVNVWESGIGFSKEEKVANARWCIENHSMPTAEACKMFGLQPQWIYVANAAAEAKKIVADIPKSNGLAKSVLQKLHALGNSSVIRNTARVLCEHEVKGDECNHLIADVRKHSTELQALSELGRWEKLLEERKSPKKKEKGSVKFPRAVRDVFFRNLTGLAKIVDKCNTLSKLQVTDSADLELLKRCWHTVQSKMESMLEGQR
jgi:hypothetical protein